MKIKFVAKNTDKALYNYTKINVDFHEGILANFPIDKEQQISIGIKKQEFDLKDFVNLIRKGIRLAKDYKQKMVYFDISEILNKLELNDSDINHVCYLLGLNLELANYDFRKYLTKPKEGFVDVMETTLVMDISVKEKNSFSSGQIDGQVANQIRDICNTRGMDMTPRNLVLASKKIIEGTKIKMTVYDDKKIAELKMGGIIAVGKGSAEPSRFIILEYWGKGKDAGKPIVLVGKGITFDTGGLDLKPSGTMNEMNYDMSGGANVLGTIVAIAKKGLKKNIVAIIPAVENSVSGSSYRPGDIIRMFNGKTVEIKNTDAEGRLVLADSISFSYRYKPAMVIDVATLTGASLVALGTKFSAILGFDQDLNAKIIEAGNYTGDLLWQLPILKQDLTDVVGNHSDLANLHKSGSKYGGTIIGAVFLAHFVEKDIPWAHIDMAPRMTVNSGDNLAEGSAGEPMRALIRFIEKS